MKIIKRKQCTTDEIIKKKDIFTEEKMGKNHTGRAINLLIKL
jgi:hypothetical protein